MRYLTLFITVVVLVGVILVGVIIYQNCTGNPFVEKIDNTLPDIAEAPFQVVTRTHLYYAEKAEMNLDESATMINWYESVGGGWIKRESQDTIPQILNPRVSLRE